MSSLYYCIDDVLNRLPKGSTVEGWESTLIKVSATPVLCGNHVSDCFTLANPAHMLNFDDLGSAHDLAQLMKDVPLYHYNMELILDEALAARHQNSIVREAIEAAFAGHPLPNVMQKTGQQIDNMTGSLRHPMIEHMDKFSLSEIYVRFLQNLKRSREEFNFGINILGKHTSRFLEYFDGYFSDDAGQVRADVLLSFGLRLDHDPHKPLESYIHSGQMEALKLHSRDTYEIMLAWLECDHYQMRRSRDIDRVLGKKILPRPPNWIRIDVFRFLEKEAMKQHFAELMVGLDPDLKMLARTPQIKRAVRMNAAGQIGDSLQQLLSETMDHDSTYSGAAQRLFDAAENREFEAHKIKASPAL